jgi:hypothetical protein
MTPSDLSKTTPLLYPRVLLTGRLDTLLNRARDLLLRAEGFDARRIASDYERHDFRNALFHLVDWTDNIAFLRYGYSAYDEGALLAVESSLMSGDYGGPYRLPTCYYTVLQRLEEAGYDPPADDRERVDAP